MQFLKVFIRRQLPSLNVSSEVPSFTDVVVSFPPPSHQHPQTHTHTQKYCKTFARLWSNISLLALDRLPLNVV